MEYRRLGASGFTVPALSFGAGTFGGKGELFAAWGSTDVAEARRLVDLCLDAGVNMLDTADIYSRGASESIVGEAIKGRRDKIIVSTKATFRFDDEPNNVGSSRYHLIKTCEESLKRLGTDYIDLFQLHGYDAKTPPEEVLSTLDTLVRAGKIRYVGVSNFSGWHIMKALATADRYGYPRYVANQTYYSLLGREYEWELMPLGLDEGLGAVVWSPLGWGRLKVTTRRRSDRVPPEAKALVLRYACAARARSRPWRESEPREREKKAAQQKRQRKHQQKHRRAFACRASSSPSSRTSCKPSSGWRATSCSPSTSSPRKPSPTS